MLQPKTCPIDDEARCRLGNHFHFNKIVRFEGAASFNEIDDPIGVLVGQRHDLGVGLRVHAQLLAQFALERCRIGLARGDLAARKFPQARVHSARWPLLNEELIRKEFWDFGGVRIEDDVVVTATGIRNLTKCPRTVDFEAELPRHPTGKLYKRLLRDRYWQGRKSRIV